MPFADWDMGGYKKGTTLDERKLVTKTHKFCGKFLLQQIITKATHRKGNTLDLVFTYKPDRMHSQSAKETALSDHFLVAFNTNQIDKPTKLPGKTNKNGSFHGFHKLNL